MIPAPVSLLFEGMILLSMLMCLVRVAKGPTSADRMVAVDLLGLLVALLMVSHVIRSGEEAILDVVLIFSIVAFFGTVAFARYLQRQASQNTEKND